MSMTTAPSPPPRTSSPPASAHPRHLHWQILSGLVLGAVLGVGADRVFGADHAGLAWVIENIARPIGAIFLNLIFMVVLPLVFSALVLGVAELGDVRRLGRLGLRTLAFTLVLSSISVLIGVGLTNLMRPGDRLTDDQRTTLRAEYGAAAEQQLAHARQAKPLRQVLVELVPRNLLREMVGAVDGSSPGGGMLAVMVFALLFGIALTVAPARTAPLVGVLEGLYDVVMVIVGWAMRLAPLAVAALMFALTATLGFDILRVLAWYIAAVLTGLVLHNFGVYSLFVALAGRMNPLTFFARSADASLTAFATSSSNATLPTTLRVAEERLGIPRSVGNFVLTVGSTANQNGTALYEGVTVLFLAQVFGVDLTLGQQLTVALLAIMAGVGTAGVPGGSLPLVVVILQTVHVPPESIGIILGVDRVLDMCRTSLNVTGDLAVAACVARGEARSGRASMVTARGAHE